MYNIRYKITAVLTAVMAIAGFTSCNIEPADRFEQLEEITPVRNVLLMDFTGQGCVNCPEAQSIMHDLIKQYDNAVIGVSIHGGAMAVSVDNTDFDKNRICLMIKEGDEINQAFNIQSWPYGAVDHINDPNAAINSSQWASAVRRALTIPAGADIKVEAKIVGDNIEVYTEILSEKDRNAALQIWVVEDGIVSMQSSTSGIIPDYVHNDVLRFVQYPVREGKPLQMIADVPVEDACTVPVKYTDKERWNRDNLSIVAFVFEGTEILQTVRAKVVNE